jgi:hypothetical protein
MPELVVLSDPITCERTEYEIRAGETVGAALMRIWPHGLNGSWRIYRDLVSDASEIAAVDLPYVLALEGEMYVIVLDMAGPAAAAFSLSEFLQLVAVNMVFSIAAAALAPKPPRHRPDDPDHVSPNNLIAAQTNTLRPGARVPELLGRVRAYPDLLCSPVDVYNETSQTIGQMFVLGKGAYDVPEEFRKLGETPLSSIKNADLDVYLPGTPVNPFYVIKNSREIGDISLLGGEVKAVAINGDVDFIKAGKIMRTLERLPVSAGKPIKITDTFFNNAVFWVVGVPADSVVAPPYDYLLDGPVENEIEINANYQQIPESIQYSGTFWYGNKVPVEFPGENSDDSHDPEQVVFKFGWPGKDKRPLVGDYAEFITIDGDIYRGQVTRAEWPLGMTAIPGDPDQPPELTPGYYGLMLNDLAGRPLIFTTYKRQTNFRSYRLPAETGAGAPGPSPNANEPTNWYAVPMEEPQEIWVDFAFPGGLVWFDHGSKRTLHIEMSAEFRRVPATEAQVEIPFDFTYATTTPMRFTRRVDVATLISKGLPAGPGQIEVRTRRVTDYYADTTNNQYVQDTRWVRLAAVRQLIAQTYEDCTILALTIPNNRSAGAIHDMNLNVIATRILPTWTTGAGWSAPAPTRKWADHFVARCQAQDGAHRDDSQIDIAGIYKLQQQLDDMDRPPEDPSQPGLQGEISMTLDQVQDIDAELAAIADVARAVVYRVGRKLFVTRDQANLTAIALFNARAKGPDGETVSLRMTGDADNDCVVVTWVDERLGWKQREYRFPEDALALNPLRVGAVCANWPQARRRAVFEWNKLRYRRETISVSVTEDGRICRPGDVIHVTDDLSTMATCAGEVIAVNGAVLTLDRDVVLGEGSSYLILLRDNAGALTDLVPCTPIATEPKNRVTLSRPPQVKIKGRDSCLGTLFAFYPADGATVRPWMVLGLETAGPYVTLTGTNYTPKTYTGDSEALPSRPPPPNLS